MNRSFYILFGLILSISMMFPAVFNLLGALDSTQALVLLSPDTCPFARATGMIIQNTPMGCEVSGQYHTSLFDKGGVLAQSPIRLSLKPRQIRGVASISRTGINRKETWAVSILAADLLAMVFLGWMLIREIAFDTAPNQKES